MVKDQIRGGIEMISSGLQAGIAGIVLFASYLAAFGVFAMAASADSPIAIKGYDTVAYFMEGSARQGVEAFSMDWHGMMWHFSSRENMEIFRENPAKYAPQYDGYCAWAMSEARKAIVDPEVWKIVDGRLYLNCSNEAYEKWSRDIPGNIEKADRNWKLMQEAK